MWRGEVKLRHLEKALPAAHVAGYLAAVFVVPASERPELTEAGGQADPSSRVDTPDKLRRWLASLGLEEITVRQVRFVQPLHPDDTWSFYLSAAMRAFVEGLPPDSLARVRTRFLDGLHAAGIDTLDASSLIAVGHRPQRSA